MTTADSVRLCTVLDTGGRWWHTAGLVELLLFLWSATPQPALHAGVTAITVVACGQNYAPAYLVGPDSLDLEVAVEVPIPRGTTTILAHARVIRGVTTALDIAAALRKDFDTKARALHAAARASATDNTVILVGGTTQGVSNAPGTTQHGPAEPYLNYLALL